MNISYIGNTSNICYTIVISSNCSSGNVFLLLFFVLSVVVIWIVFIILLLLLLIYYEWLEKSWKTHCTTQKHDLFLI